jgi:hypothetical protein
MEVSNGESSSTEIQTPTLDGDEAAKVKLEKSVAQEKNLRERLKSTSSELETLRSQLANEQEKKLKEQNEYKTLYETTKQTVEQLKKEKDMFVHQQLMAKRLNAFDNVVGKLKHEDFYKLLPIDKIIIEDDGSINRDSIDLVAKEIKDRYGDDIFEKKQIGKLPSGNGTPDFARNYNKASKDEIKTDLNNALRNIIRR